MQHTHTRTHARTHARTPHIAHACRLRASITPQAGALRSESLKDALEPAPDTGAAFPGLHRVQSPACTQCGFETRFPAPDAGALRHLSRPLGPRPLTGAGRACSIASTCRAPAVSGRSSVVARQIRLHGPADAVLGSRSQTRILYRSQWSLVKFGCTAPRTLSWASVRVAPCARRPALRSESAVDGVLLARRGGPPWTLCLDLSMVDRRLHDDLRKVFLDLKAPRFDLHRPP
jgi:hypothetical protein